MSALPPELQALIEAENDRGNVAFCAIVERWPNFRKQVAVAVLGMAVASADSMGVDVEGFIRELRARFPKPDVLVPPRAS